MEKLLAVILNAESETYTKPKLAVKQRIIVTVLVNVEEEEKDRVEKCTAS